MSDRSHTPWLVWLVHWLVSEPLWNVAALLALIALGATSVAEWACRGRKR